MIADRNDAPPQSGEIATRTLADIYAKQGLYDRAIAIYRRIQRRSPDDAEIADRIATLSVRSERDEAMPRKDEAPTAGDRADIPVPMGVPETAPGGPASKSDDDDPGELEMAAARTGPPEDDHPSAPVDASERTGVASDLPPGSNTPAAESDPEFLAWLERR